MLILPSPAKDMLKLMSILAFILYFSAQFEQVSVNAGYLGDYPPGCDSAAALQCEYDFLLCKLFNGPANDRGTLCNCASSFYGICLRLAGVRCVVSNFLWFSCIFDFRSFEINNKSTVRNSS